MEPPAPGRLAVELREPAGLGRLTAASTSALIRQDAEVDQAAHPSRQPLLDLGRRLIEQLGDLADRQLAAEAQRERVTFAAVKPADRDC